MQGTWVARRHRLCHASSTSPELSHSAVSVRGRRAYCDWYDQKSTVAEEYDSIAGTLAAHDVLQMRRAFNTFLRVRFYQF